MIFCDSLAHFVEVLSIGLASGIFAGAFGVGGGIISTPLIRHLLNVSPHIAIGSTLAVMLPTAIVGMYNYLKEGKILVSLSITTGITAVLSTIVTSYFSHYVNGQHLMLVLCGLMILMGLDLLTNFRGKILQKAEESSEEFVLNRKNCLIALTSGLMVGVVSGFLGIGGGFLLVPAYSYFFRLPIKIAFGTSLVVVAIVALPGTIVHAFHKHVDLNIVLPMLAGSMPGAWVGSYFSLKTKDRQLKTVFGGILIAVSVYFIYREHVQQKLISYLLNVM